MNDILEGIGSGYGYLFRMVKEGNIFEEILGVILLLALTAVVLFLGVFIIIIVIIGLVRD